MKFRFMLMLIGLASTINLQAQSDSIQTSMGSLVIHPVQHASMVLYADQITIYVDPVGGASRYKNYKKPDFILITDIHGDHMDKRTVDSVRSNTTTIITPKAVKEQLQMADTAKIKVLNNGDEAEYHGIAIRAVPMYNLPEAADTRHTKGRGNGYVLTIGGKRIYISGDTEDIPEMRQLKDIDIAFVCMNLPYTMDVKQAASAVLEFKPKIVYPYHYRGQGGFSDVNAFEQAVTREESGVEVRLRNWYSSN
jgi:L-ascorbate metabolism protein UlaG (beta-lactamase superfamily)